MADALLANNAQCNLYPKGFLQGADVNPLGIVSCCNLYCVLASSFCSMRKIIVIKINTAFLGVDYFK